jgi:uncharacterized metal-binding protein
MPSGRTHDRITLWCLPIIAIATFAVTRNPLWTLVISGGFLFGGLMFGPDLDIHSVQYKRWGWLRWIWLPYRASMRHRSPLSHGPILGTALRIFYFTLWLVVFGLVAIAIANGLGYSRITHADLGDQIEQTLRRHAAEWGIFYIGLELGALSHYVSDTSLSTYKRVRKHGWSAVTQSSKPPNKRSNKSTQKPSKKTKSSRTGTKKKPRKSNSSRDRNSRQSPSSRSKR